MWRWLISLALTIIIFLGLTEPGNAVKREYVRMRGGLVQVNSPDSSTAARAHADISRLMDAFDEGEREGVDKMEVLPYLQEAISIADSVFGHDSPECIDIMTTRMLPELSGNRELLQTFYKTVAQSVSPFSDEAYGLYYLSARQMEKEGLDSLAMHLYHAASRAAYNTADSLKARTKYIVSVQRIHGGNLAGMFGSLVPGLQQLSEKEEAEALFNIYNELALYYDRLGDQTKALKEIGRAEAYIESASTSDKILLMQLKYRLLLDSDHQGAIECLDRSLDYAQEEMDPDENQSEWIAAIALQRGDYSMNEELDELKAVGYYYYAAYLLGLPLTYATKLERVIGKRLALCTLHFGFEDTVIRMYKDVVAVAEKYGLEEEDLDTVLDLAEAYLSAGLLEDVGELLLTYRDYLENEEYVSSRYLLLKAKCYLADGQPKPAAAILEELMDKEMPESRKIKVRRALALAYTLSGDTRMEAMSDTINSDAKRIIASYMRNLTPSARRNWLVFCEEAMESQLKLSGNPRSVSNAAEMNLFRKSLLFRTSDVISKIIASIPENAVMLERLNQLGKSHNEAVMRGNGPEAEDAKVEMELLEQRLSASLATEGNLLSRIDCRLEEVAGGMGNGEVAVDFIEVWNEKEHTLGAFLWSANKDAEYVDITSLGDGWPENIGKIIWNRLSGNLIGYDTIYFSADGRLNSIPIEYTLISGTPVNELYHVHRVFHLSDISKDSPIGDSIAVVAVADHNSPLQPSSGVSRGNWADLPETEVEKDVVLSHMAGHDVTLLYNDDATEANVKRLDGSRISALHISTHGVFRDKDSLAEAADNRESDDYHVARRMLAARKESLSGLILREGNIWWHSDTIERDEDDILTAEEIELLHFPDLRLTVLSACDTGLGEVDSEGVWGLQRAFRIAGTKALICALNKVDDYWAARFMDAFYERLGQGDTIYSAFSKAQHWLYDELPDNPEVWSAFILIE